MSLSNSEGKKTVDGQGQARKQSVAVAPPTGIKAKLSNKARQVSISFQNNIVYPIRNQRKGYSDRPKYRTSPGGAKRATICFIFAVGVFVLAVGFGCLYVATKTGLRDFKVLGPGGIVFGAAMIAFSIGMICYRQHQHRRFLKSLSTEVNEYWHHEQPEVYEIPRSYDLDAKKYENPDENSLYGIPVNSPIPRHALNERDPEIRPIIARLNFTGSDTTGEASSSNTNFIAEHKNQGVYVIKSNNKVDSENSCHKPPKRNISPIPEAATYLENDKTTINEELTEKDLATSTYSSQDVDLKANPELHGYAPPVVVQPVDVASGQPSLFKQNSGELITHM